MTDQREMWTALSERGQWRGADTIAAAALEQVHERSNGERQLVRGPDQRGHYEAPKPAGDRRLPDVLVAAVAFVLVGAVMTVPILVSGLGGGEAPESDIISSTSTGGTGEAAPASATTSEQSASFTIPGGFVSVDDWPSPVLDPVLNLPQCSAGSEAPGSLFPDSFFAFLGLDRGAVKLSLVDPAQVAVDTPMMRAGHASILSVDAIAGGCLIAVADGDVSGWSLYLADGEPAMTALSVPLVGMSVPEKILEMPGSVQNYQQWITATGESLSGNVSTDGQVHAVAAHRLYIATFDPGFLPTADDLGPVEMIHVEDGVVEAIELVTLSEDEITGPWLLASLAVNPIDLDTFFVHTDETTTIPAFLPSGFGMCAATYSRQLHHLEEREGRQGEGEQLAICNSSGSTITISSGQLVAAPGDAAVVDINGHDVAQWTTTEGHALQFSRSSLDVLVEGPADIDVESLKAVLASMPLASPPPPPPTNARALVGVGDGIDALIAAGDGVVFDISGREPLTGALAGTDGLVGRDAIEGFKSATQAEFYIPDPRDLPVDETGMPEYDERIRRGEVQVEVSDSMRAIQAAALGDLDAHPYNYFFALMDDAVVERASFYSPSFELGGLLIGQQTYPTEWWDGNPIARVEETYGAWQVGTSARDDRGAGIEIIAYSPSIERMVNISFEHPRNPDGAPISVDEAQGIAYKILDAIARSE